MELVNAPTPDDDVHMHDEKTTVRTQEFSAELLNVYYSRLFPYNEMYRWLSYGNTYGVKNTIDAGIDKNNKKVTVGQPEYFFHREISFTLDVSGEEVYIRYLNFKNAEEMRKKIMQQQPRKIDIGAIYSHEPSKHDMIPANVFKPLERELVFDIDLTDYDDVGAKGADISRGMGKDCWYFMSTAVKVVDKALREDFNFKHLLWIFSGRRGVHCWVCDKSARTLDDKSRAAIVNYLTVVTGNERSATRVPLTYPLHPSLQRSLKYMEAQFIKFVCEGNDESTGKVGQGLLESGNFEGFEEILSHIPQQDIASSLNEAWRSNKNKTLTAEQRWGQLKKTVELYCDKEQKKIGQGRLIDDSLRALRTAHVSIIFMYVYPRLDVNVSTHRNHLLKSPWCVHPKTGRVCVPIDPSKVDEWDPHTTPTVASLADELDSSSNINNVDGSDVNNSNKRMKISDVDKTSLKPYMEYFENSFLAPLYADIKKEFREEAEKLAAVNGDW